MLKERGLVLANQLVKGLKEIPGVPLMYSSIVKSHVHGIFEFHTSTRRPVLQLRFLTVQCRADMPSARHVMTRMMRRQHRHARLEDTASIAMQNNANGVSSSSIQLQNVVRRKRRTVVGSRPDSNGKTVFFLVMYVFRRFLTRQC